MMDGVSAFPIEVWTWIAAYLDEPSCTSLILCCKHFSNCEPLKAVKEEILKKVILEYLKSPIHGTQAFRFKNESSLSIVKRLMRGKQEYEEMEKRFPSTIHKTTETEAEKLKFENYFGLYQIWKKRTLRFSDEESTKRNQKAFEYYHSQRSHLEKLVQETWGTEFRKQL
eukprot:Phypoly_transcript_16346.p1 GENE.Phypoly_transcript_16346~~Phypoly_transcript_16346.p1  ORF type:complete len:169 (+),score=23.12 Phypoly_transcript_16346:141-647(+)